MDNEDFYKLFISHLKDEIKDIGYVKSIEELIDQNKFNKSNYMKLIKGDVK